MSKTVVNFEDLWAHTEELATHIEVSEVSEAMQTHKDADMLRWQDYYNLKALFLNLQASIQQKTLSTTWVSIETEAQSDIGFTVTSALGGRIRWEDVIVLLDLIPGSVSINGVVAWSSQGLGLGTVNDYADVQQGDVIKCSGVTSIEYSNYEAAI